MYYLYILQSEKINKRYIGVAEDMATRIKQHNNKQVHSTKAYTPWRLVYTEKYQTKTEALQKEYKLKHNSWEKKELFDKIDKDGPIV